MGTVREFVRLPVNKPASEADDASTGAMKPIARQLNIPDAVAGRVSGSAGPQVRQYRIAWLQKGKRTRTMYRVWRTSKSAYAEKRHLLLQATTKLSEESPQSSWWKARPGRAGPSPSLSDNL